MLNKIYIQHHLGLGDNIVHNGLIRKISFDNPNSDIYIPIKYHNYNNISFMFSDNNRIKINKVNDDFDVLNDIKNNNYDKVISTFLVGDFTIPYDKYFDDAFYIKANIDPSVKKEFFHIERDLKREEEVYNELITNKNINDYIFLHEKMDMNISIDRNKIRNDLPIVYAEKKYGIFELLTVMERAKECHLVSSSFLSLMLCNKYNENIYAHMYADRGELSEYIKKNNIEVIL
jgi:hypothetical protein